MMELSLYAAGSRDGFPLCGSPPFSLSPAAARHSPRRARRTPTPHTTVEARRQVDGPATAAPSRVTSRFTGRRPARGCTGTSRSRTRRGRTTSAAACTNGKIKFGAVSVGAKYKGKVRGTSMSGTWTSPQGGGSWSATKSS